MKPIISLRWRVPMRKLEPQVYDNYRAAQDKMTDLFKSSAEDFNNLEQFYIVGYATIRRPVPKKLYTGLTVCGKPVEEVGCGIICTAQAMFPMHQEIDREAMEEIVSVIEEKEYYLPGSGLYWHWFNNFCRRATHWYEIIMALQLCDPVTVLIKRPGDTRNYFMNLLGIRVPVKITSPSDVVFITSDEKNNCEITLAKLMEQIVTAPWIWC